MSKDKDTQETTAEQLDVQSELAALAKQISDLCFEFSQKTGYKISEVDLSGVPLANGVFMYHYVASVTAERHDLRKSTTTTYTVKR
jgi:hypothetical protein